MNHRTKLAGGVFLVVLAVLCALGVGYLRKNLMVTLPDYQPIGRIVWLEQNWNAAQRAWFHHADQGALTFGMPYEWFVALEQPALSVSTPGLLSDPAYLDRYGFIPGSVDTVRHELPVGFAHGGPMSKVDGSPWRNPQTGSDMTGVGLTCAACHTGRFTYHDTTVLIDGAPALTNLDKLQTAVGLSLLYTRYVPFRFNRFAGRVLGSGASDQAKLELRSQLDQVLAEVETVRSLNEKVQSHRVEEGYTRLDALNRIGNAVFALDLNRFENYAGTSAPVHFPRIWNASWFGWVQYNGAIQQPMVRNAGEALGVLAPINLTASNRGLFDSGIQFKTLVEMERLMAGEQPDATRGFNGLNSPKWPTDILPPINDKLAAKGAVIYTQICQDCHLAPVSDAAFWASERWLRANSAGERYLDLELIDVKHVGTDPAQAEDMQNRKVSVPAGLGISTSDFGGALGLLVEKMVEHWYDGQRPPVADASRQQMNGNRENGIRAPLAYKVRPLNGVWATPPYLHNGSVPNVYALLSPVAERPTKFFLGNREYDPVNLGYRTDKLPGGFQFDTTVRGNSNAGHEFANDPGKSGVIGRVLTPDERLAVIEYLKTL